MERTDNKLTLFPFCSDEFRNQAEPVIIANSPTEIYEFDGFRLDVAGKVVFFEEKLVSIRPKVVEILTVLVQKRGEIVTKHEFIRDVWNNSFVAESGIHRNISMLREVLEKTSQIPRTYIETIPRRGYRFLGEAKLVPKQKAFRLKEESENTMAVLPFRIIPTTKEYEYLGLGLADALITSLSNLKQIIVRPTDAIFRYLAEDHNLNKIGQQLKVKTVLSGNLFLRSGYFRLSVQHLEVASEKILWGESFSGELMDTFEAEEKIVAQLKETLGNHFNAQNAVGGRGKTSREAY